MSKSTSKTTRKENTSPVVDSGAEMGGTARINDMRTEATVQRKVQKMADSHVQSGSSSVTIQKKANSTGMSDQLKSGIENLSGVDMSDVKVHYNSTAPAQLQAHAFAQGNQIHLGPGQERHLPHEAWHVVQQKQGRVQPTRQLKSKVNVNDDPGLEKEADKMGAKAMQFKGDQGDSGQSVLQKHFVSPVVQRTTSITYDTQDFDLETGKKEIVGKKMVATLDPADKVKGSAPGSGVQALLMTGLKAQGYKRMVRGHLLNGQLGGLGIAANLYPISSQANSKHKLHMENYVKKAVKDDKKVKYTVEVVDAANKITSPKATFKCKAEQVSGGTWSHAESIVSNPGTASSRGSGIEGSISGSTESKVFRSADLPSNWGQKGSGYNSSDSDHSNSVGKSSFSHKGSALDVDEGLYHYGRQFDSGTIDLAEGATELAGEVDYPVDYDSKRYEDSDELTDFIETLSSDSDLEALITHLESL